MTVLNLRAPTGAGDVIRESGIDFISWDGTAWTIYKINQDNPQAPDGGGGGGGGDGVTDAQRAQLIAQRNPVPTGSGSVLRGTFLQHTEGAVNAFRLILSTGSSVYSLTQPT